MTTRITVWGTAGRIFADRQEIQVYLRDTGVVPEGYEHGWNVRYGTELTEPVGFYLRGEEYSAQIDHFVERVARGTRRRHQRLRERRRDRPRDRDDDRRRRARAPRRPLDAADVSRAPPKRRRRFRLPRSVA